MMDLSTINNHYKQDEQYHHRTVLPSRTASNSFAINNTPKITAIKRTKQIRPFSYLFQPVDPPKFSSHNNHGICVKVIEYVLEIEKRRLTDQISENTQGANLPECSTNKYAPVNYGTITNNNQVSIPSELNTQHAPQTRPTIIITNNEARKKCMPNASTSKLTPENIAMYENSAQIYNFSKTMGPVKSTSNNEQNGFPQISNSTSKQYFSSFAKYTPKTQIMPNPRHIENWEGTKTFYHPTYDLSLQLDKKINFVINTPTFSSFQFTNEPETQYFTFPKAPESIPPDQQFGDE